jgi:hypothetical protein
MNLLFNIEPIEIKQVAPQTNGKTCLTCIFRERHQCGGSIIQYCGVRKSNRTINKQLKIKCKTPACHLYKNN